MSMRNLDREVRMISDVRVLHAKLRDLYGGFNATRQLYTDQELIEYAEIDQVRDSAEKLREMHSYMQVMLDALSHRK
jgi:hypothetical protein